MISSIETNSFSSLKGLKNLNLSGNRLTVVSKNQTLFHHLSQLGSLDLSMNVIDTLESLCFQGLTSLSRLNLSHNSLSNLQSATFYHLGSLQLMDLSFNKLKEVVNGTFFGLNNLTTLLVTDHIIFIFITFYSVQFLLIRSLSKSLLRGCYLSFRVMSVTLFN